MPEMFKATVADMLAEVKREVEMRRQVYPRRVAAKTMSQDAADRRIAIMVDLAEYLQDICGPLR